MNAPEAANTAAKAAPSLLQNTAFNAVAALVCLAASFVVSPVLVVTLGVGATILVARVGTRRRSASTGDA